MRPKTSFQISTVYREHGYVHKTLESLKETGFFENPSNLPLNLVVGSDDASYLQAYEGMPDKYKIHAMSREQASVLAGLGGMQKAALNHGRCLSPEHVNADAELIAVIEDDVRFARGWTKRFDQAVEGVSSSYGNTWVMCMYTPLTDESAVAARESKRWFDRKWDWFFGTQGTVYPKWVAAGFVEEINTFCVNPLVKPYDIALSEFLRRLKIPIVATAPCLVQHMGSVSQGVCGHFHQSKGFMDEIPE